MAEIKITQENFENEVVKSDKPVLLDFWASWCGPCAMMAPVVEEIADTHAEIKVGKVNIDEESALANAFHVMSIPTLAYIKDGKVIKTSVGYMPKEDVEAMLN